MLIFSSWVALVMGSRRVAINSSFFVYNFLGLSHFVREGDVVSQDGMGIA